MSPDQRFRFNPPATAAELATLNHLKLPDEYLAFLSRHDGGEGFLSDDRYAVLWKAGELERCNKDYQAPEYVPGFFLIGSDGGGEAIAFDRDRRVVQLPFIGMSADEVQLLADGFTAFMGANL